MQNFILFIFFFFQKTTGRSDVTLHFTHDKRHVAFPAAEIKTPRRVSFRENDMSFYFSATIRFVVFYRLLHPISTLMDLHDPVAT